MPAPRSSVKTIATEKAAALVLPAALFRAAFVCVLAGVTALALGVVLALAKSGRPLARRACRAADSRRHRRRTELVCAQAPEAMAMNEDRQVDAARIEVERARARLMGSAHELQDRLGPQDLARRRMGRALHEPAAPTLPKMRSTRSAHGRSQLAGRLPPWRCSLTRAANRSRGAACRLEKTGGARRPQGEQSESKAPARPPTAAKAKPAKDMETVG